MPADPGIPPERPPPISRSFLLGAGLLGILIVALIVVPFLLWGEAIEAWTEHQFEVLGPAAALLGGAMLAADIVFPIPTILIGIGLGAQSGFVLGTIVGTVGLSLGCFAGYAIGSLAGKTAMVQKALAGRAQRLMERYGLVALFVLRPIPLLGEATVLAAGALRYPFRSFAIATTAANACVSAVFAMIGAAVPIRSAWIFLVPVLLLGGAVALFSARRARAETAPPPPEAAGIDGA